MTQKHYPEFTENLELIRPVMISDEMVNAGWYRLDDAIELLDSR